MKAPLQEPKDMSGRHLMFFLMLAGSIIFIIGLYHVLKQDPVGGPLLMIISIPPLYTAVKLRRKLLK